MTRKKRSSEDTWYVLSQKWGAEFRRGGRR
jgi:hypothetical protein